LNSGVKVQKSSLVQIIMINIPAISIISSRKTLLKYTFIINNENYTE